VELKQNVSLTIALVEVTALPRKAKLLLDLPVRFEEGVRIDIVEGYGD